MDVDRLVNPNLDLATLDDVALVIGALVEVVDGEATSGNFGEDLLALILAQADKLEEGYARNRTTRIGFAAAGDVVNQKTVGALVDGRMLESSVVLLANTAGFVFVTNFRWYVSKIFCDDVKSEIITIVVVVG